MKQWLRVLYFPVLIFAVLTVVGLLGSGNIRWMHNVLFSALLGVIGTVGQFLIHKNILRQLEDENEEDGCINCGRPE